MGQTCSRSTAATTAEEAFFVSHTGVSIPVRTTRRMGWKKDLPDFRDRVLAFPAAKKANLPCKVDLRPAEHFPIYDQGHLGSCTANAIGAAFHFNQVKEGKVCFTPSRLFIYWNERAIEGSIEQDAGAYIRDGMKSVAQIGVCDETKWPYNEAAFTEKPSDECYTQATLNTASEYARVPQTLEDIKAVLNAGFPFAFGFTVLQSFFDSAVGETGIMPMPSETDYVLGGHAVQACGYDDEKQAVIVRNSWGAEWGDNGYFYMPYAYIIEPFLVSDLWAIKFVEGEDFPTRKL